MSKSRAKRGGGLAKPAGPAASTPSDPYADGIQSGLKRHRVGDLAGALAVYEAVLEADPAHADALQLTGTIALQTEDFERAVTVLQAAWTQAPDSPLVASNLSAALLRLGRFDEAQEAARAACTIDPANAEAHNNLGNALRRLDRCEEADAAFRTALQHDPDNREASANLQRLERSRAEADTLKRARAHLNAGEMEQARAALEAFVAEQPDHADAYNWLGGIATKQSRYADSARHYRRAAELRDDDGIYDLAGVAVAKAHLGETDEALSIAETIHNQAPTDQHVLYHCADVLFMAGRLEACVGTLRELLAINPDRPSAHNLIANALSRLGHASEASLHYLQALRGLPEQKTILSNLANATRDMGSSLEAHDYYMQAVEASGSSPIYSNMLMNLHYIPGLSPEALSDAHMEWGARMCRPHLPKRRPTAADGTRGKLRIGYVSADFRRHSVAYFFEPLLDHHDRARFDVYLYSNGETYDETTERLEGWATVFRPCAHMTDEALTDLIREDGIDILVDLSGHTSGNRQLVFARRPAPVQVSWLGYPNTTGNPGIDYRFTDAITEPPALDPLSAETPVRLPSGFHCYRPPANAPEVEPRRQRADEPIVFGSFNAVHKINDQVIQLWARILEAVPGSRLLIKHRSMADPLTRARYAAMLTQAGVDPERIEVMTMIRGVENHLAAYNMIDIALDTFPYNGTTTTCEALWMGVPVVTMAGACHVSRVSASLLSRVGLEPLVGADADLYVEIAASLAHDPAGLIDLRRQVRSMVAASPLRDEAGFARAVEQAYADMWAAHVARGAQPAASAQA